MRFLAVANNPQPARAAPGASAVRRNAPGGDFIDHFMSPGDNRTHTERINPLVNGESFGWCPGANRGFQSQPLQTFNISDQPIGVQIAAPPIVLASEPEVAPLVVTPPVVAEAEAQPQEEEIMSPEAVAEVAHSINKAICEAAGDHSQPDWAEAPDWQKQSAVNGVAFHMANPDASPSASHENWMAEKIADGWIHGPVKDPDLKRHPCIVPYDELPFEQRVKDHAFLAIVHALAPRIALPAEPAA